MAACAIPTRAAPSLEQPVNATASNAQAQSAMDPLAVVCVRVCFVCVCVHVCACARARVCVSVWTAWICMEEVVVLYLAFILPNVHVKIWHSFGHFCISFNAL